MVNNGGKLDTQLMFYIWDNIIELVPRTTSADTRLSNARNIVLIGHGSGCAAVMDIVNNRGALMRSRILNHQMCKTESRQLCR